LPTTPTIANPAIITTSPTINPSLVMHSLFLNERDEEEKIKVIPQLQSNYSGLFILSRHKFKVNLI
jgi:hypothetical protein